MGRGGAGFLGLMPRPLGIPGVRCATSVLGFVSRLAAIALVLLLPSVVAACGGGGGGSPTDPGPSPTATPTPSATPTPTPSATPTPTPGSGITFTAASSGPGIVLAQGAGTSSAALTVDVRAAQVTGLYGIAFDLDYPAAVVRYRSAVAGTFLGSSGQFSTQVFESASGHLVVGVTRLGALSGVDGSGVVVSLVFGPAANGSGPFAFSRNTAFSAEGAAVTLPWASGTVTVAP